MHVSLLALIILMCTGFCAAFIDSIAGGGGLLMVPAFLTAGIPPYLTLGTNKLAATMGVATAAYTYVKKNLFKAQLWIAAIIAAFIGSVIGAIVVHLFSARFLKLFLPLAVILVAVYALWPKKIENEKNNYTYKPKKFSSAAIGLSLGFYDGFFGPGTGSFWTTAVMLFYKMDMLSASGVARFMNFVSNLVALITFIILGNVDVPLGFCVGLAMIVGSYLGAHSAIRYGVKFIKPIFVTVVIIMAIRLIYVEWL